MPTGSAPRPAARFDECADAALAPRVEALAAVAGAALREADAGHGLAVFLERSLGLQVADRGLNATLADPRLGGDRVRAARARIAAIADALVRRGREQGALRADVEGVDVLLAQRALAAVVDGTDGADAARYRRSLTTFLETVRAGEAG